jgi:hypothetical protein
MKYCRDTTINHVVALKHNACLEDINSLIRQEGYSDASPLFTNAEIVLNMDKAEDIVARLENRLEKNKSMDMAFGIAYPNSTKVKMLLVELRLNYSNPNNLSKAEIEEKVAGTSLLLSNIPEIIKMYIFIFKTGQLAEAYSRLFRMIPKINSNYVVMDIEHLKSTYF